MHGAGRIGLAGRGGTLNPGCRDVREDDAVVTRIRHRTAHGGKLMTIRTFKPGHTAAIAAALIALGGAPAVSAQRAKPLLYKQMIPDLNALLPTPNPTWTNMAALAKQLNGAVLMGHSESGFYPEEAALIDASGIRGMISIEQQCLANLPAAYVAKLAKIPTLVMFGDHLGDAGGFPNWQASLDGCQAFVDKLKTAGGDAEVLHLPELGIKGNSHMLMQDKNNLELADLILAWIDEHVEGG